MMKDSQLALNWIAASQAPRNDVLFVMPSEAWQSSRVMASEARQSTTHVIASEARQSTTHVIASEARQSRSATDMPSVPEQSPNWIATSQAPRNDVLFVMASEVLQSSHVIESEAWQSTTHVIASEARQSRFVSPQTFAHGAGGFVCMGGVA